jgi:replicative DNA helicase
MVLFVHREEYYNREDPSLTGKGELIVAKARNGPLGTAHSELRRVYLQVF